MLSVDFDSNRRRLDIRLDIPMPREVAEMPAVKEFLGDLKKHPGVETIEEDGSLGMISIPFDFWLDFSRKVLSGPDLECHTTIIDRLVTEDSSEQGAGLSVNFHQKSFDTPLRAWNFFVKQGYFTANIYNRLNWYLAPKYRIVTPFPLHVDIESASTCNMDCPMCYRRKLKETGQMDFSLFQKIVDECHERDVFSVRLSWRGETLSHPRIKEFIKYATERIRNVSFLTNAFYLSDDIVDCLLDNHVSYISVSFDGIGDTYEKIRAPAKYEENYQRLANLMKRRNEKSGTQCQVRACTIWPAISDDPDAYYEALSQVTDYLVCNPYINFEGSMKIKPDFICQYPWERIVIGYNGDAQCCTGWNASTIILGNVVDKSISEMWHSDRMQEIRDIHAQGKRLDLDACAECRHGSQGDPSISVEEILERRY